MAIRAVNHITVPLPTVEEVMERWGLSRDAAALYLLVECGEALIDDLEFVPEGRREAVRREEEEAEAALIAAMEQAAEVVDPSATVEENMARTGLDRRTIELYLSLRPRDASSDDRERLAEPPE